MSIKQAVILAAGQGTRMHPLTYTRSKGMLPVSGKPVLEHLLGEMKLAGILDFIFIVGFRNEQIQEYFGDGSKLGVTVRYCQQTEQMGTAHALILVKDMLDGVFLVTNGDAIFHHRDIKQLISCHETALGVIELEDVTGLGVVEERNGTIIKIQEKLERPLSKIANAGLYVFDSGIFSAIENLSKSPRGEYELTAAIQTLIDSGQKVSCHRIKKWWDFTYPWDLLTVNEKIMVDLNPENCGEIEPYVRFKEPVSVGKGTIIRSGAYITGPVFIGENCDIGPNCYIRPYTVIGNYCHIGAGVEVKNSIIMNGSKIPHLCYVGDSVIGENCNLGAGTKVANLKLNHQNVQVAGKDTGRRKLGVIMGDNVQTGINSSINVGTLIGNDCLIGPGALVHGIIAPRSKVF